MMKRHLLLVRFVLLIFIVSDSYSYNILVIFPHQGRSHFNSFAKLFKELSVRGHNVTVISQFPLEQPLSNYRDIKISKDKVGVIQTASSKFDFATLNPNRNFQKYVIPFLLSEWGQDACEIGLSSENVHSFLREENHFDVAIIEYFNTDCFLSISKKFKVPTVRAISTFLMPWSNLRFGNPSNPAYIPNHFMPFSDKMVFTERVENLILQLLHSLYFNYLSLYKDKKISMKYLKEFSATMETDIYNDSLILVTSHYSFNLPRPLVPSVVEVGGLHVEKPKDLSKVRG